MYYDSLILHDSCLPSDDRWWRKYSPYCSAFWSVSYEVLAWSSLTCLLVWNFYRLWFSLSMSFLLFMPLLLSSDFLNTQKQIPLCVMTKALAFILVLIWAFVLYLFLISIWKFVLYLLLNLVTILGKKLDVYVDIHVNMCV